MAAIIERAMRPPTTELITGALVGGLAFGGVCIPKAIIDVVGWLTGVSNTAELVKGAVDLGAGLTALYDVNTRPKDDFWRGVGWSFGLLESIFGGFALATALTNIITGSSLESPAFKLEKGLISMMAGRKY
jgi:hypothetical protein